MPWMSRSLPLRFWAALTTDDQRVNIDFPRWLVRKLDEESKRLGVSRQALVKIWIAERMEKV